MQCDEKQKKVQSSINDSQQKHNAIFLAKSFFLIKKNFQKQPNETPKTFFWSKLSFSQFVREGFIKTLNRLLYLLEIKTTHKKN